MDSSYPSSLSAASRAAHSNLEYLAEAASFVTRKLVKLGRWWPGDGVFRRGDV